MPRRSELRRVNMGHDSAARKCKLRVRAHRHYGHAHTSRNAYNRAAAGKGFDENNRKAAWTVASGSLFEPPSSTEIEELLSSGVNGRCEIGLGGDL